MKRQRISVIWSSSWTARPSVDFASAASERLNKLLILRQLRRDCLTKVSDAVPVPLTLFLFPLPVTITYSIRKRLQNSHGARPTGKLHHRIALRIPAQRSDEVPVALTMDELIWAFQSRPEHIIDDFAKFSIFETQEKSFRSNEMNCEQDEHVFFEKWRKQTSRETDTIQLTSERNK